MSTPDLSIIIVSWNVKTLLRDCLHSIFANQGHLQLEVIVVDSDSSDGSAEMVRAEFPQVTLILPNRNVGFPRGNNLGLEVARGRYILLLNPDTVVMGDALGTMVTYLEQHASVGLVGAQLLNEDGSVQSSRRRFPTLATALFESTWLQPYAPKSVLRRYYVADQPDEAILSVDWVMGACMLTRADIVSNVGGMDEAYFMYSEELDWCRRIKETDMEIIYLPTAQVIHFLGKSSEQLSTARHINFNRAKLRYFRKYHGWLPATLLRVFLLLNFLAQIFLEGIKGLVGHKRPLRWQRVKSYWKVVQSGLRPAGY